MLRKEFQGICSLNAGFELRFAAQVYTINFDLVLNGLLQSYAVLLTQ